MTQAIPIPAAPAIIPAATYLTPEVIASYQNIEDVPYRLQAMETVMVYIGPSGRVYHLNGPLAGTEGVRFAWNLQGEQHVPFEQVIVQSAYLPGVILDRVNYLARKINFRVFIGNPGMNNITYRACEDAWWSDQDEQVGGWFGVFTRFSGWRWIKVFPEKTVDTTQKMDPVAYDNNQATWDVNWLSPVPFYTKPAVMSATWSAANSGPPIAQEPVWMKSLGILKPLIEPLLETWGLDLFVPKFYHGTVAVVNRGDLPSQVQYMISATDGICIVQDNNSTPERDVTIPPLYASDGQVLVDTDPTHKTIVAENDPFDNIFYQQLRAAGLLNFLLGISETGPQEPVWLRGYVRFMYSIAPGETAHLHIKHTNPNAQITALLPQKYKRSR